MKKPHKTTLTLLALLMVAATGVEAAYKCKAPDGRIEYSDRPCEVGKDTMAQSGKSKPETTKVPVNHLADLDKIFEQFREPLCEREKLAGEIDRATRNGELKVKAEFWRPKQDRMNVLNDTLVSFQERVSKITRPSGPDSPETMSVRKFQISLKTCDPSVAPRPSAPPKTGK